MAISASIQSPGTYFEFLFTSKAGGFAPLPLQIALLGVTSTAATEGEPIRVLTAEEADAAFGVGSELALMCRAAFAIGALKGTLPAIYGVPIAEATIGPVTAVSTITIGGVPTAAQSLVVRIAGRTFTVPTTPTSTPTAIAADLKLLIDANSTVLPITAGVAAGVVTGTAVHAGENGNQVVYEVTEIPAGLTAVVTQTVVGAGVSDPQNALDALSAGIDFNAIAMPNNTVTDVTKAVDHVNENNGAWAPGNKLWRRMWFGENGSLGDAQTLASADNYRISVAALRNARSLPSEIAAACAALSYSEESANFNFDGAQLDLYGGAQADAWTGPESESHLAAGVSPLQPDVTRDDRASVKKLVTTQVNINGFPSLVLRDIVVPKVAAFVARQHDAQYNILRPQTVDDIRDVILQVNRTAQGLRLIRNVESLKPQITAEEDPLIAGRALAKNPIEVVIPLHQAVFTLTVLV